jgi:hypothetical protein
VLGPVVQQPLRLLLRQRKGVFHLPPRARTVLRLRAVLGAQALAHGLQLGGRVEGVVGVAVVDELLGVLAIPRGALALAVRTGCAARAGAFVVGQAAPVERAHDVVLGLLDEAFAVGVFDAEDELAAAPARQQVIVKRRPQPADVQHASRAGGEAHAHRVGVS